MHFSTAVALALSAAASLVAAQDKNCPAQNIVDACLAGYKARIDDCNTRPNDFICLCDVYTVVLQCYINCPNSQDKPPVQSQVTSYCNAAEPLRAAYSASMASVASVAATQAPTAAALTSGSNTRTVAAMPTATGKGTAAGFSAPAGAALMAMIGAAAML